MPVSLLVMWANAISWRRPSRFDPHAFEGTFPIRLNFSICISSCLISCKINGVSLLPVEDRENIPYASQKRNNRSGSAGDWDIGLDGTPKKSPANATTSPKDTLTPQS